MQVISLGWGVQSFALAAMSALGDLPPVDVALHADTGHERFETYDFAKRWTPWLQEHGVKVVTVKGGRPIMGTDAPSYTSIPGFTAWAHDVWAEVGEWVETREDDIWVGTGEKRLVHRTGDPSGMLRRQCTYDWKIAPIRRWLQKHRNKKPVQQWIGITLDEVQRMKPSDVKYQQNCFPFIEDLDRPWTRHMVKRWLTANDLEIPVKSSCVFCPYHDRATWRDIKLGGGPDWDMALQVDAAIRDRRPGYTCYLIKARIPLDQYDFSNQQDRGQMTLWDEECEGMCFL